MSMIFTLREVSEFEIKQLMSHPDKIEDYLDEDGPALAIGKVFQGVAKLLPLFGGATATQEKKNPPAGKTLCLEKSWHGLHYLLTGTAWDGEEPACFLAKGGTEVGEDLGYGPARILTAGQVNQFSVFLNSLDPETIEKRNDPAQMAQESVYGVHNAGDKAELRECLEELKGFAQRAAERQQGLLLYLL